MASAKLQSNASKQSFKAKLQSKAAARGPEAKPRSKTSVQSCKAKLQRKPQHPGPDPDPTKQNLKAKPQSKPYRQIFSAKL